MLTNRRPLENSAWNGFAKRLMEQIRQVEAEQYAGWELRKDTYVTGNDGVRKRKQPYIAHLSREAFGELKKRHTGAALERAIADWIEEHDR